MSNVSTTGPVKDLYYRGWSTEWPRPTTATREGAAGRPPSPAPPRFPANSQEITIGEYGQFCPVAKATEVLDERWTMLVVRELLAGSSRFNDIHRGVPRMSRTLLSKRLGTLTHLGLVQRREDDDGPRYQLTAAGQELGDVIDAVGRWGIRWMSSLGEQDLDPALLVWDMHRRVDQAALPDGRTTLALTFTDVTSPDLAHWWLVMTPDEVDVCDADPGYDVDVRFQTPLRTLVRVWRGDLGWNDALRSDQVTLTGRSRFRRQLPDWLQLSPFATVPRT